MPHATGQRQLVGHSSPQPGCGKIRRREHQSCQITTDFPRRTHAPSHSIGSAPQHREHNARQLRARGTSCNGLNVLRACALGARVTRPARASIEIYRDAVSRSARHASSTCRATTTRTSSTAVFPHCAILRPCTIETDWTGR